MRVYERIATTAAQTTNYVKRTLWHVYTKNVHVLQ